MYEPLSEPFVQVRVCATEAQVAGSITIGFPYAVTELPLEMLPPQGSVQLAGTESTVTVTEVTGDCPATPVQYSVYTCVEVRFRIIWKPAVFFLPFHDPPAVQEVAFVEDQERNVVPPDETAVGFARKKTVGVVGGGGGAVTEKDIGL